MNDINKLKNYREKYKRYYGIEFGKEFVIHHIDEDRSNNDISNLLLLPLKLHTKYHLYKNQFNLVSQNGLCLNLTYSDTSLLGMQLAYLDDLVEIIKEIQFWIEKKHLADIGHSVYPMFEKRI